MGTWFGVTVIAAFVAIWANVLTGNRLLVGADALYAFPPWSGAPGAHSPRNWLVLDAVREFVPWLELIQPALRSGHLPLWDPYAMSGKPLFADYVSAVLSPFTLVAAAIGGSYGYGIAMLLKLWVAGLGMLGFLRLLDVRPIAAGFGALSFATCSYIVVWMAWPQSGVAALAPLTFAAVELNLRRPGPAAVAALAAAITLVLLAGHPESSLIVAEGLVLYAATRCLQGGRLQIGKLVSLTVGASLGIAGAAIQLLPFGQEVLGTSLGAFHQGAALNHLDASALSSWLVPNLHGNPGIDGQLGRPPHYNASTAFAGVAALVSAAVAVCQRQRFESVRVGLLLVAGFGLVVAYGPLSAVLARVPLVDVTYSPYATLLICFAVASLAGLGLEALLRPQATDSLIGAAGLFIGWLGLVAVTLLTGAFVIFGVRVETATGSLPAVLHSGSTFWALLGAVSLVAAVGLTVAIRYRGGSLATGSLLALAVLEAGVFAGTYQPQVPSTEVYPKSAVMAWLAANTGDQRVAGIGTAMIPETATFYGLSDVRGYDVVRPPGMRRFWSLADAGYYDDGLYSTLARPDPNWLAAAGVEYVVTLETEPLPGTIPVFSAEGATVNQVRNTRPLVFAAKDVVCAPNADQVESSLKAGGPLTAVVLQTAPCPAGSAAQVTAYSPRPEQINLRVAADSPTVVVVLQSNTPDWSAMVDGKPAPVLTADLQFQAVAVPAGTHLVSLVYNPRSLRLGILISALALAIFLGLLGVSLWRSYLAWKLPTQGVHLE